VAKIAVVHNAAQTAMMRFVEPVRVNETALQNTTQIATPQSGDAKAA